ncbi:hypothetical protein niasHT_013953 [Heterodera trifolii]|uniref:Uncharacterized protein n=1 Tax=Heterodera trifolii TaxID=157864 RepID=A0ABD2L207_9BILA
MLDINPEKRMSATAIIDFLNGGCAPNIGIGNEEKMPIFGETDADFLSISLRAEIYRVKGIYEENKKIRLENLEKIQALLKTMNKRQKLLFSMLAKRKRICEGQKN